MKKCKICKSKLPKRFRRYCSAYCRQKYHNHKRLRYHILWQRNNRQKLLLKKYKHLIQCLICKKWYRQVGSHIVQTHNCTAREYREDYGFDRKRGQLSDDLRELKAKHVFQNKTVKNLKQGIKYWFKKGDTTLGVYKRSQQTMERLRLQGLKISNLNRITK